MCCPSKCRNMGPTKVRCDLVSLRTTAWHCRVYTITATKHRPRLNVLSTPRTDCGAPSLPWQQKRCISLSWCLVYKVTRGDLPLPTVTSWRNNSHENMIHISCNAWRFCVCLSVSIFTLKNLLYGSFTKIYCRQRRTYYAGYIIEVIHIQEFFKGFFNVAE